MEEQSSEISSSRPGGDPYETGERRQQPDPERRQWDDLDDVLDLTGGAGQFSQKPFTVPYPARDIEEEEEEEDDKPTWKDSLEPSPVDEEPGTIGSVAPHSPAVPSAPMEEPERPAAPYRDPSGSVAYTFLAQRLPKEVVDLVYWRDIKKSGAVFGASLFLLLSLSVFSIVSVLAYIALALLSVSISFRIYRGVLQAIQKSDEGHPFRSILESNLAVPEDLVQKYCNVALNHVNCTVKELRRLFLVEDLVDSLKFAVLMWVFTYIGALFNGLTLLILALISLFSIPVIYERHQTQVDHYLALINKNVKSTSDLILSKVPGLKRKAE
ncbi:reticulon-4 isoform X5 [Xenopus tropicalis]|uniref:Reticulon n=1 Tax=Xenopus tropicalis TaxID=8364 RepID=A0A6I8SU39_XENTR|nr:reticulon-4 isoform X5 [Xenopus tropicalis]|eukprot:XP_012818542.1 PREDICTED: reticulon-4 isoform X7 [Xenopus tropicalis]